MKVKENKDGTKELEGTPEELAAYTEYERQRKGEVKEEKKNKKVLRG